MSTEDQEILARFHRALVREIHSTDPGRLSAPFTVAEIYQNLIPYRTHREELGVEMNGDYEHALLRLLAGEGDFLTIESRTARQEIREELDSPNPNTSLYRDFAAADVRLNPEMIDEAMDWDQVAEGGEEGFVAQHGYDAEELMAVEEPEPLDGPGDVSEGPDDEEEDMGDSGEGIDEVGSNIHEAHPVLEEEAGPQELPLAVYAADTTTSGAEEVEAGEETAVEDEAGEEMAEAEVDEVAVMGGMEVAADPEVGDTPQGSVPDTCPWCRENLPRRDGVSFCPFCGSNVKLVPCPACGEELELNWRFCVACGTEVAS